MEESGSKNGLRTAGNTAGVEMHHNGAPFGSDPERKINPGNLRRTTWVDMVEIGNGCKGDCLGCGAFEGECSRVTHLTREQIERNLTQEVVDVQTKTRYRIADLLRRFVTTGVDTEPLDSESFIHAAELIPELTNNRSRMVCISHGLAARKEHGEGGAPRWTTNSVATERLRKIVQMMVDDKVPLFVLSLDPARSRGVMGEDAQRFHRELLDIEGGDEYRPFRELLAHIGIAQQKKEELATGRRVQNIEPVEAWEARLRAIKEQLYHTIRCKEGEGKELNDKEISGKKYFDKRDELRDAVIEANARSYAATIWELLPAIRAGKRVTVSQQGDNNSDSLVYTGLTTRIWQRTLDILYREYGVDCALTEDELVHVYPPRLYVGAGRMVSRGWGGGIVSQDPRRCTVIPDPGFVKGPFRGDEYRENRGVVRADGRLEIQRYRGTRTYNDTVDPYMDPNDSNPWVEVNLEMTGDEFANVSELPEDLIERFKLYGRPRFVEMPEERWSESSVEDLLELSQLETLYPFDVIKSMRNTPAYQLLIGILVGYLRKKGYDMGGEGGSKINWPVLNKNGIRKIVIEALIPEAYVEGKRNSGEDYFTCASRLADEIIRLHSIEPADSTSGARSLARRMGEVLAIKNLLREYFQIRVRLSDESPWRQSGERGASGAGDFPDEARLVRGLTEFDHQLREGERSEIASATVVGAGGSQSDPSCVSEFVLNEEAPDIDADVGHGTEEDTEQSPDDLDRDGE